MTRFTKTLRLSLRVHVPSSERNPSGSESRRERIRVLLPKEERRPRHEGVPFAFLQTWVPVRPLGVSESDMRFVTVQHPRDPRLLGAGRSGEIVGEQNSRLE